MANTGRQGVTATQVSQIAVAHQRKAVIAAILLLPPLQLSGGISDLIPAGTPIAQADATAATT